MNLQTLQKGLEILFLFKHHVILSVPEMAAILALPSSSIYRYITNLKGRGLIDDCEKQGYYRLGKGILDLAEGFRDKPGIADIAFPTMRSLQKHTGETILLNGIQGHKAVCIKLVQSDRELRVTPHEGKAMFLHAGACGKVIMAYLSKEEQDSIMQEGLPKFTKKTVTDHGKLRQELICIKQDGYCVSGGEFEPGTRGIAAPILDPDGKLLAGLGLIGPAQRVAGAKITRYTGMVVEAAQEIGRRIQGVTRIQQ